jgi:hypothetical protein
MSKATSLDSIPRLSFRKRKANHLLPFYEVLRTGLLHKIWIKLSRITNTSNFPLEVGEIWIDNKQQGSTEYRCDKRNLSLLL